MLLQDFDGAVGFFYELGCFGDCRVVDVGEREVGDPVFGVGDCGGSADACACAGDEGGSGEECHCWISPIERTVFLAVRGGLKS